MGFLNAFRSTSATPRTTAGERVYAIGDIHGRYDLLCALLEEIERHSTALPRAQAVHVVLLGDLIDRGPDAARVVDLVRRSEEQTGSVVTLLGNHEDLMLRALDGESGAMRVWMRVGGRATLRSFGVEPPERGGDPAPALAAARATIPEAMIEWIRARPLTARSGDYLFCHAGIRPGIALKRQTRADLLWIRDEFLEDDADHGFVIVHGHSVASEVEMRANRIGIDTGAYRTGVLSALYLEDDRREIISVKGEVPAERR